MTNSLFNSKCQAHLFREDQPQSISQLFTSCTSFESFSAKIAGLCTLFEIERAPIQNLVTSPENLGTIKLIERWLDETGISYDPSMLECWEKIRILRNSTPLHARKLRNLSEILDFFGVKSTIDSQTLWDSIMIKFIDSLKEWHRILCGL